MSERARFRVLLTATTTILSLNKALAWTLYATRPTYDDAQNGCLVAQIKAGKHSVFLEQVFDREIKQKAFEATSIAPIKANVVLERFRKQDNNKSEARLSALLPEDWRQMERLIRAAVKDTSAETSQKLSQTLHQLQVQNELLHYENSGLRDALTAKKQQKQHQEEQERLAKLNRKELQAAAKLLKEQEKEERRVARERAKEVRDQMKAEQVAARDARKAAQNTRQASTITQRGKRKASKAPLAKRKLKRAKGGAAAHPSSLEATPAPPPKVSSRGRAITLS
ncbi:hypothetical protein BU23DRAFT_595819 [Bimuria novae-zelandiae CBS 107.79]|uniref:Uncharacterized protein n=1 Tax=Bimuria novae-zelandiae CBS 107.79 TaxID=1447943 RepID=A0A6A5VSL0_9PLEO|nr:hypothetical protein BU23DRAFT_595819 [Bimuria novae-zelandiae CBS 107.79]